MENTSISAADLEALKGKLIHGDISKIISFTGRSRSHIHRVLDGETEDLELVEAITKFLAKRSTKANKLSNRIKDL